MGISDWFSFKSPEQRAKETRDYEHWAFPFGQQQKDMVFGILKELLPEEDVRTAMMVYLIGREGYRGSVYADPDEIQQRSEEEKIKLLVSAVNPQLLGKKGKKLLSRYAALIIADSNVDGELLYPSVEQLRAAAVEMEPMLVSQKR